jgi:molybdopterin synthase catalytic subunit
MSFRLSSAPLDPGELKRSLLDPRAGACVTFEGWVRDHNDGRSVGALDYEAYPLLAEKEGARIVAEAKAKFPIIAAVCVHRIGSLQIGDMAVWVGVVAAHRGAAFDACRYIIDEAKARVPIWKKEHYADGTSDWINCAIRGEFATEPTGGMSTRPPSQT